VRVVARTDACDGWLVLETPFDGGDAQSHMSTGWWTWLRCGSGLGAPVKLALRPGSAQLVLRADIPLGEDVDTAAGVQKARVALASATQTIGAPGVGKDSGSEGSWPAAATPAISSVDLATLCAEAGWPCVGGSASTPRIDLRVSGRQVLALLERRTDGGLRVWVELWRGRRASLTRASQAALGFFLLTSSAIVRLARAYVEEADDSVAVGFDVRCLEPCGVEDIDHALSALSVACAMCDREVQALADDRIARIFMALRHQDDRRREST